MKTTLNLDDELLEKAREYSGIREKTALIHKGLETLIENYSRERLIKLGGLEKKSRTVPRRRAEKD